MPRCSQCHIQITLDPFEVALTERIRKTVLGDLPLPTPNLCTFCRHQVRGTFRNERFLYHRKDDLDGKQIISVYTSNAPFPVYSQSNYFSDKWDALSYGRNYDATRPFFDQLKELYYTVPRMAFVNQASENSEYCNYAYRNKNCYLVFGSHYEEDCFYETYCCKNKDVVDSESTNNSEKIYQGYYVDNSNTCTFVEYCLNSSNCHFSYDLIGCHDCFLSFGLRNKQYMLMNEQLSESEYKQRMSELNLGSYTVQLQVLKKFHQLKSEWPKLYSYQKNAEDSTGDQLENSKNAISSFNIKDAEDVYAGVRGNNLKVSAHVFNIGYDHCECLYEAVGCNGQQRSMFVNTTWHGSDFLYCEQCFDSQNLFGCIGIKNKKYCILNKQYSKEEYEQLVKIIITNMVRDGEFGNWFPKEWSPFGYNETRSMDFAPLTKEQAVSAGFTWKDEDESSAYQGPATNVPDNIKDVDDSIIEKILLCESTKKPYKIIKQELAFYKKMNLPIPHLSPNERNDIRTKLRKGIQLRSITCHKCQIPLQTNWPAEEQQILCESCYQNAVD